LHSTTSQEAVIRSNNNHQSSSRANRINHQIRAREVRVIKPDGEQAGVMSTQAARQLAQNFGLDLVEISPTAEPPVCRIMDYGKYKYDLDKKVKDARKKQVQVKIKEVKFRPNVDEHDYETKLRHVRDFLEEGNRVKCSLMYRGRENAHHEIGINLFNRIIEELGQEANVEQTPKLTGRHLNMMLSPGKSLKK